ncbi:MULTISPECIES: hypothetical protein [unclassified Pseudomonas]|nr:MULTISPECIES: hypothetical protein [unclassified Pseudomonas]
MSAANEMLSLHISHVLAGNDFDMSIGKMGDLAQGQAGVEF